MSDDRLIEAYLLLEEIQRGPAARQDGGLACSGQVPVVLQLEAEWIISRMSLMPDKLRDIRNICLRWTTSKHNGLQMYEKVTGRAYTRQEKFRLAGEIDVVKASACPFVSIKDGCMLPVQPLRCLLIPKSMRSKMAHLQEFTSTHLPNLCEYGFLPTLIASKLDRPQLKALIQEGRVPDAALAMSQIP